MGVSQVDELKEGDKLIAATSAGLLTTDTVSFLSVANPQVGGTFLTLTTQGGGRLRLTGK